MKTVLCVPGHDEHKVKNCRKYGADLILFDLEDSVPDGMKDRAREIVAANITEVDAIRVNSNTATEDLRLLRDHQIHSVWLPKMLDWPFFRCGPHAQVAIVETPQLVARLHKWSSVAKSLVSGLAFGAADFAAYMNVPASSRQVECARQQVALAAAALGVESYDSPCTTLDMNVLLSDCESALDLGYGWKGAIHPKQIPMICAVRSRTYYDDRSMVDVYDAQEEAVMTIGKQVIAPPMIRAARQRLEENK